MFRYNSELYNKLMLIGVDAGCLGTDEKDLQVGVYQVAYHLLKELSKLEENNSYHLYSFEPIPMVIMKEFGRNMKNIVLKPKRGWSLLALNLQLLKNKPDIYLAISQTMPFYHPFKTIGFVHGLDLKKDFHPGSFSSLDRHTRYLLAHADRIITTTDFLRKQILTLNKKAKIKVLNLGISECFKPKGEVYRHQRDYFLYVGSFKITKNIPRILEAFANFLRKTQSEVDLILVGSDRWMDPMIKKSVNLLEIPSNVILKRSVSQCELGKYYRGAIALVSPSIYEGFGLPLIEAMACGCVVITGNKSAEKEIVCNAGILVDPESAESISKAMNEILDNSHLRSRFRKEGLKRAKLYSWGSFADGVLKDISDVTK